MNLSVIIIARNEQEKISNCIKNLAFAQEIILIDNDSDDKTGQIAKSLGVIVHKVKGLDFSYLRNQGKEKAKFTWLLYIDADEIVSVQLAAEIKEKLKDEGEVNAYNIKRQNYYFGYPWPKTETMVRLIKKRALIGWKGSLHETPIYTGKVANLTFPLHHYTHDSLSSMVVKTNAWSDIEARLRYDNNHPPMACWRFIRVIIYAFLRSYLLERGWRSGTAGLIESIYQSYSMFISYAKLWEKQNSNT